MNRAWIAGTLTPVHARTAVALAVMTVVLLAGNASPAAAESEQAAAAKAVPGRMLVTPRAEALVKRLPVRVVVRAPARTRRLRVRLGGRDVTPRFRRARGSLRVAHLTPRNGLRYGLNHLVVLAERRGLRPVMEARSFVLARRQDKLVRLRIRRGPVTSVNVRVAAPRLAPEHFGQPGEVDRRLSAVRRRRTVRIWLNGRRVNRALDRSQPTRWTASLSASHGLRYGVNRLRTLVVEADRGRYALARRRFVVRRNRHLAAAGWDTATRVGGRVRLDGRRSRTARGGRPDHSWRILSKPRGSRAKLRRAGSARALLAPDRRGRYVVGLTVRARPKRATAAQATPPSVDRVSVTAGPAPLLVPFKGLTVKDGHPGIQVGGSFYPNPSPNGAGMQWLTLDRATLLPTKTGNTWLDGTGSGDHGIDTLTTALSPCPPSPQPAPAAGCEGLDQLVILSFPYGAPAPPLQQDQNDAFNGAMKAIGVGPIDAGILQDRNKLVIVGVPFGGDGSGWYTHGGGPVDGLTGWLMPDVALNSSKAFRFRVQPERPAFDTSASHTATTNTMTVRDQRFDAALPAGASGGFQVVTFDPIDLTPVDRRVFSTNHTSIGGDPLGGRRAMAQFLNDNARDRRHVAVQSIGQVSAATGRPEDEDQYKQDMAAAWWNLTQALAANGANPHTFYQADGPYALFGGTQLKRSEMADSSSAVVTDPTKTPPTHEPGTLRGRMTLRGDGYWVPAATQASQSFESSLYDIVFRDPTPWLYTEGGSCLLPPQDRACSDPEADAYAKALADITHYLYPSDSYKPDLRQAYVKNPNIDWSGSKTNLAGMRYPGDDPGYTRNQFRALSTQLQLEFDWLDKVKTLFDSYEKALNRCGATQSADLEQIGEQIRTAVAPDDGAEIAWSVGSFVGAWYSAAILAVAPEATPVLAAWEALVAVYDLVRDLASDTNGQLVGDQVKSRVDDLAHDVSIRLFDTANGLDRLRQVIVSDYGRLKALGQVADSPGWAIDVPDTGTMLCNAAEVFFYSELMPIPYGVWALRGTTFHEDDNPDTCRDSSYGHTWRGAPATAQMVWMGGFDLDGVSDSQGRFMLGRHSLSLRYYAYPPSQLNPPTLTNRMFLPLAQGGLGMQLPQFVWEQYESPPGSRFPPTDIAYCYGG